MECSICLNKLTKNTKTLECGHTFHYDCLQTSLRKIVQRTSQFKKKYCECPYCRSYNGYIPLLPQTIPIKGVHREFKDFEKNVISGNINELKKYLNENTCGAILKSGTNKGSQCQKMKKESGYCSRHEKYYINKNSGSKVD